MTRDSHIEAELLAAWAERRLTPADGNAVEAHLATCPTCQEVLAVFVRAEPQARPAAAVTWFRWRWAVPVAVAATAAAIWVAVPDRNTADKFERTTARAAESAASTAPSARSNDALAPPEQTRRSSSRTDTPAAQDRAETEPLQRKESDQNRKEEARESAVSQRALADAAPPAAAAEAPAAPPAADASRFETATPTLRAAAIDVPSPDPLVRWRIVPPGRLQRTTNGGMTWEPIELTDRADVVGVRAPRATTAIVTVAGGRQFRTDDRGKTWNPVR